MIKQAVLSILLMFFFASEIGAQENVFLSRSYWKADPSVEQIKKDIASGNDPSALNSNAFDGVVYALLEKVNDEAINYLLTQEGNGIDKRTHDSRTYLHWAAYSGKTGIVKKLLEQGASVTVVDSHGSTPLTFAASAGQKDVAIYDLFIQFGVNLAQETNEDGANTLLLAAPFLQSEEDIAYFENKGIDINSTDTHGNGIFNYASKKGNIDFLKLLVDKGIDYKTLNNEGGNAFLFAAQGGRGYSNPLNVYTYLKTLGLEPNIVTKSGYTPLHRLAYNTTDPAILQFFISAGAGVNQKDSEGNTPFLNVASRNTLEMVQLLSEKVTDFNDANENGQTALMLAVQGNSPEVTEFLLKKGSDALAKDASGNTLAYYLVTSFDSKKATDFERKLKLLQQEQVSLNEPQAEGNTLLHLAAKANNLALLKRLSDYNISVNAKNDEGLTALHLAAMKAEDDSLLKYLISIGGDSDLKTDFEESVYDLASENELLKNNNIPLNFLK